MVQKAPMASFCSHSQWCSHMVLHNRFWRLCIWCEGRLGTYSCCHALNWRMILMKLSISGYYIKTRNATWAALTPSVWFITCWLQPWSSVMSSVHKGQHSSDISAELIIMCTLMKEMCGKSSGAHGGGVFFVFFKRLIVFHCKILPPMY